MLIAPLGDVRAVVSLSERLGFDEAFDATAPNTRRKTFERACLLAAVFCLSAPLLGLAKALSWWGFSAACEVWLWLSTSPAFIARARVLARCSRLGAAFMCSVAWAVIGYLFWFSHEPMAEILTVALLAGVMIYVVHACYRSPAHILSSFVPPAVLLALLPFSYDYDFVRFAALEGAFMILVGFAGVSAFSAHKSYKGLVDAARALAERSDAADAANRAKSDFLANMSHEIRTPLNGVLGMAQAMANDDLPPAQLERLQMIRQSGQALLSLLNDLLDLSKIEAGKTELEDGVIDVGEMAEGARTAFTTLVAAKNVFFVLDVSATATGRWRGDVTRVRQILYNLVSNAVKFTTEGSVRVLIDARDGVLFMRVTDTGPGIPADRIASLFDKFVQVDASTTRKFGGTGLGLAISRHLAELMGGGITVDSVHGEGSAFEVRLPLQRLGDSVPAAPAAEAQPAPLDDLRILAAEDNPLNQMVLKTLMGQVGLVPQMVDNGAMAVQAWESGEWDAILMDVQMPEMDGPTATRLIRSREAETGRRRTPIIALTANAMAHQAAEYAEAGMDLLVSKPIEFSRLLEALDQVLSVPAEDAEPPQSLKVAEA